MTTEPLKRALAGDLRACANLFRIALALLLSVALTSTSLAAGPAAAADPDPLSLTQLVSQWGNITAPVYGIPETTPGYAGTGADLFAGPQKFGNNYFAGVLPNGKIVKPAGKSAQIGMNPLGIAVTPDGKFLITSNDDERETGFFSYQSAVNFGGYSLSVIDTSTMQTIAQLSTGKYFIGLQVTGNGPYTVWASGGPDNDVKIVQVSPSGSFVGAPVSIPVKPITPSNQGFVSNYTGDPAQLNANFVPSGFNVNGTHTTFPAGSALSPDGKFLYVACNGDNSLAVIDTAKALANPAQGVVAQIPVGYFPYSVAVSSDGSEVTVSNWGVTEYKFKNPTYDQNGKLINVASIGNQPDGFYVPKTSTSGSNPKTSSVSLLSVPNGDGSKISFVGSIYEGHKLDSTNNVGDTHPSAMAIVTRGSKRYLFVTKTNNDALGVIDLNGNVKKADLQISILAQNGVDNFNIHGSYPNAMAVSPDNLRMYVAEAGLNSVAVFDMTVIGNPQLLGRIPTGWYPTALALSADGKTLYIANAKGIGEDINPKTQLAQGAPPPTGLASDSRVDSNYVFGTVQQVDLTTLSLNNSDVLSNNYGFRQTHETSIVPDGSGPSQKIKHVIFIMHENKTFDSMLGNQGGHFGNFASTTFNDTNGVPYKNGQYTGVSVNTQLLATTFAAGVNYYSDSEESDAGHQFCSSGTASDYTEKTLLVKSGRGLLVNKNFEPEDYPEHGYLFNNAVRNGLNVKSYAEHVARLDGTDTGVSTPTTLNDPTSGNLGYPALQADNFSVTNPLQTVGDVTSPTQGIGQSYFMALPALAVLGKSNPNGEPRFDPNYPGYNFNISDQRRAQEFIKDFDRMVSAGTLPQFIFLYQPNDHTGSVQAPNKNLVTNGPLQQVADGDVALGMAVQHIMKSPVYYDPSSGLGTAIFMTYDDAQSSLDHIHPHRTPVIVISPYAKPAYSAVHHYNSASIVKTEELLLGLPPNNLGDLLATDMREFFQPDYNKITADQLAFTKTVAYRSTPEGKRIWALVDKLDTSAPDRDSFRLGALGRMSIYADQLHRAAVKEHRLNTKSYRAQQAKLYKDALELVHSPAPRDLDD